MADPTKVVRGGLNAVRMASKAADQAMEAKRLAREAANPPIKASDAYGKHEGAYLKPIFYDRMKVDLSKRKFGGPGFSGIQLVDPNYADAKAAAGVTDQVMATRILNRNTAQVPKGAKVIWTPSVGGLEQHKSNSTMFGQFANIFADQRKNMSAEEIQKLSDRASSMVDNKGRLIFPNGIDLGSNRFRQQVKTYNQRALMADIFAGRGVGGEAGRTVPVEELLEKNLDPNMATAGTLDLGNRLFRLEGNVIDRPDLHTDYRKILTGEDLDVNYLPAPIRDVYSDWEAQKKLELLAQGKDREVTLMDYTKNDPTVQLTDALLTKMQKAGLKKGGAVTNKESPEDMDRFNKLVTLHKADGGKIVKGLMGAFSKAGKMADEKIAADAIGKAAESAGMKAPVTANKPLTNLQDFHTSLGDRVRQRATNMQDMMESMPYKYGVGQSVFTEDSARKNWPPMKILAKRLSGNNPMREDHPDLELGNKTGKYIKDPTTGKTQRTPYEPGYHVRLERGPEDWSEFTIPESAIKGDVEMARGGGVHMAGGGDPKDKSFGERLFKKFEHLPKVGPPSPFSPLDVAYGLYKYKTGAFPIENWYSDLEFRTKHRPMDTGSVPVGTQFNASDFDSSELNEKLEPVQRRAKGGAVGQESPEDMARFNKLIAMHKAMGGMIKKFDVGGPASGGAAFGIYPKAKGGEDLRSGGDYAGEFAKALGKITKDQGSEEVSSLKKPRAVTDLLNRGVLANNPLSAMVDLVNMGLVPLDVLGSKLTGRDIKVSSDKPFLGSEYVKDLMNKYNVTSGEERPMMETALSFASPAGMIKGALKAPELTKKTVDAVASTGRAGAKALGPTAVRMGEDYLKRRGLMPELDVYHGSPHKYDKFDASKIGTGEGAQAYGHGIYTAENPGIAQGYADRLGGGQFGSTSAAKGSTADRLSAMFDNDGSNFKKGSRDISTIAKNLAEKTRVDADGLVHHQFKDGSEWIGSPSGWDVASTEKYLYKVDLPDEQIAKMLDWDKPLSEQPDVMRALKGTDYEVGVSQQEAEKIADMRLRQEADEWAEMTGGDPVDYSNNVDWEKYVDGVRKESGSIDSSITGKDLHRMVMRDEGYRPDLFDSENYQVGTSETLRGMGIPGIKYLDATSRDAGQGTRNFVTFPGEEQNLTILERNGQPLKARGGLTLMR